MIQDQEWFIERLKTAEEFYVFVEIAPNMMSTVPITKTVAIQMVQSGAQYGYYQDDALFIGATSTDQEFKETGEESTTPPDVHPKKADPGKAGEVFTIACEYDLVEATIACQLNEGCKVVATYPAFKELYIVFQRPH